MANHLDLEEQEQLDQLKHFWKQYGNPITWALIAILGAVAAWNGYHVWQRNQSIQASAMFDEVEKVIRGGDTQKAERAFADMKDRFAKADFHFGEIDFTRTPSPNFIETVERDRNNR